MKIFGITVGRNEAERYVATALLHNSSFLDDLFFYDDESTDNTPIIAKACGCWVEHRPPDTPSFYESEGAFHGAAWAAFEKAMRPAQGDWVLVVDCDEVLVANNGYQVRPNLIREALELSIEQAAGKVAVDLNIPEVFGYNIDGTPLVRVDRLWGTIHAPRLFAYRPEGTYAQGGFGVPAVPAYVMSGSWGTTELISLMHYGYANERDQELKYARYSGREGHSNNHVQSILSPDKELIYWDGMFVQSMRGPWKKQLT